MIAQTSSIGDFFVILAGRDPASVNRYLSRSGGNERIKLIQLGLTLFVPPLVSLFSVSYLLSKVLEDYWSICLATAGYAVVIFLVDRYFVLSLRKSTNIKALWPIALRIMLAIAIGFVVSEPIIVKLFEKSIDKVLAAELKEEIGSKSDPLSQKRVVLTSEIQALEYSISSLRGQRASAMANTTAIDSQIKALKFEGSATNQANAEKIRGAILVVSQNAENLDKTVHQIDDSLEVLAGDMKKEEDGQRASEKKGRGDNWRRLQATETELINRRQSSVNERLDARNKLATLQRELESLVANENNPNQATIDKLTDEKIARLSAPSNSSNTSPEVISFTRQLDDKEKELTLTRSRLADIDASIRALQGTLTISDRDDVLARSNALWKLLVKEGGLLGQALFAALIIVFLAIDTLPLLTKLSFRSISDDITQQLELTDLETVQESLLSDKLVKSYSLDSEFAKERADIAIRITDEILRLAKELCLRLQELGTLPKEHDASFREAILEEFDRALRKIRTSNHGRADDTTHNWQDHGTD